MKARSAMVRSVVSVLALGLAVSERLIGSIRKECVDHIVVFGDAICVTLLLSNMTY